MPIRACGCGSSQTVAEAGPQAVPALIEALKNDKAAYWACVVLRDIGPEAKEAVPALTGKLQDPRPEIRREAVLALAAIGEVAAPAVPPIVALLDDPQCRTAATFALGRLGRVPHGSRGQDPRQLTSDDPMLRSREPLDAGDGASGRQGTASPDGGGIGGAAEGRRSPRAQGGGPRLGRLAPRPGNHACPFSRRPSRTPTTRRSAPPWTPWRPSGPRRCRG